MGWLGTNYRRYVYRLGNHRRHVLRSMDEIEMELGQRLHGRKRDGIGSTIAPSST